MTDIAYTRHAETRMQQRGIRSGDITLRVVLSNADTPAMRKLYSDFRILEATAPRPINSKGTGRGNAAELIITSE